MMSEYLISMNGGTPRRCTCGFFVPIQEAARTDERKAIVAWLRSCTDRNGNIKLDRYDIEAIARGEHVKKTDKTLHDNETCKES